MNLLTTSLGQRRLLPLLLAGPLLLLSLKPVWAVTATEIATAEEALSDPAVFPAGYLHEFALYMCTTDHDCSPSALTPDPGVDFVFEPSGSWVEFDNGTAELAARAVDRSDPNKIFDILLTFSGRTDVAPPDSPKKELVDAAYADQGGPVDPSVWHYYTAFTGTFNGAGAYAGAKISVSRTGPAFQVGPGANNKNTHNGGSGWLECNIVSQPTSGETIAEIEQCDINIDLDFEWCPSAPEANEFATLQGGHILWLPGFFNDLVFDVDGGDFVEHADGTARLTGIVRSHQEPGKAFEVDLLLSGHTSVPPPGNPHLEMDPAAYVANGGPIDPNTWRYYEDLTGTLTGIDLLAGAVLEVEDMEASFQIGVGANGKNFRFGASAWYSWTVLQQPTFHDPLPDGTLGELNLNLDTLCPQDEVVGYCLDEARRDYLGTNGDHAVAMPGVARNFVFAAPATWFEYPDGTAVFDAVIHDANDADRIFNISVRLSGRTFTAPPGSPKKQLPSSAYVPNGPADTSQWWYYPTWNATFIGQGSFAGAEVVVTRRGPAFQVGIGANNKNVQFGASSWFNFQTITQPTTGVSLPNRGSGDFNLDLQCPPDEPGDGGDETPPEMPPAGCAAQQVVSYDPGNRADGIPVLPQRRDPSNALGEPEGGDWLNFVSLGFSGTLEIDFEQRVMNGPGDDLMVAETSFGSPSCDNYPETVTMLASQDGQNWTNLGSACQDADFDLGPLPWARYFRLVDDSNPEDFDPTADGYDVDGLMAMTCEEDVDPTPPIEFLKISVGLNFTDEVRISEVVWQDAEGSPVALSPRRVSSNRPQPGYTVDHSPSTYWNAGGSRNPAELVFDVRHLGLEEIPSAVTIELFGAPGRRPATFHFFASRDGLVWEPLVASTSPRQTLIGTNSSNLLRFAFERP